MSKLNSLEFKLECFMASPPPAMNSLEHFEQQLRRAYLLFGQDEVDRVFKEELELFLKAHPVRTARIYQIR